MAEAIRVEPADLHASAAAVGAHAEELHVRRVAASGRIEAAQVGVPAAAAAALSAVVVKWQVDTVRHVSGLADHGRGLGLSAAAYRRTEDGNAESVASLSRNT